MSEAQPLHHQAFVYLRGVYGDDPRIVDLPQETAVDLYRISSIGFRDQGAHPSIYMGVATAVTAEYVQGTPPEELLEQLGGRNKDVSQIRPLVAELAMRVVSVHRAVYGGEPRLPVYGELPTGAPNASETQIPPEEQSRLFDILHEEEGQRMLLEKRTGEPQKPSAIGRVCHERILASLAHVIKGAVQAYGSTLGHEKVDQIARQAVAAAVWDYARLSDVQEFLPVVEGAIEQALQREIDEQQSVPEISAGVNVTDASIPHAESAPEGPNPQAQQYLKEIFGDNAAIGSRMTQADAERLLTATIVLMEGPYAFQHVASGLRAHEVVTKYVKGLSAEEIVTQCGLSRFADEQQRDPLFYVKDVAQRIIGSYAQSKGRPPKLADFWRPPGLYADIGERITRYYPTLLNFARMTGRNVHSAILSPEDAVQDAVGRVLSRVERARKEGDWDIGFNVNYFQTTIRRVYADHARTFRSRSILPFGDMRVLDSLITIEGVDEYAETERQMVIRRALHKIALHMAGHPRKELLWEAWMGVSPVVLGRKYAISPRAVQKNIAKARKLLRVMVVRGEIELPEDFS